MADTQEIRKNHGRAGWRAAAGLLVTLAGPVAYLLLLENARMRASGAPAFGLMASGAALGLGAMWFDRRWRVRLVGVFNILFLGAFTYAFFWMMALPPSNVLAIGTSAPEFVLPDQDGTPVALAEYREVGPVLIVFYRGFW